MMMALVLLLALGGTPQAPAREPGELRVPANRADASAVSGSLDGRTPPANAAAVAAAMPNGRKMTIDGASHDLFRRPETMKAIIAFLRQ
jgi:pimeloyl-ACP methyl ester carboxylesterase